MKLVQFSRRPLYPAFSRDFESVVDDFFKSFAFAPQAVTNDEPRTSRPYIDASETKDALLLAVELPGVDEKDVELTIDQDQLVIKAEKKRDERFLTENAEHRTHVERRYGLFERRIPVSEHFDREHVNASFKNGVLYVTLPKLAVTQPQIRKIPIS